VKKKNHARGDPEEAAGAKKGPNQFFSRGSKKNPYLENGMKVLGKGRRWVRMVPRPG